VKVTGTISQGWVTGSISQTKASGSIALLNPAGVLTEDGVSHPYTTIIYGLLYNWYAATDVREIAASGWHIPSQAEAGTLITYLGGATVSGGKLKETGLIYWRSPNDGATNEVGFNGRGSGIRWVSGGNGAYANIIEVCNCWVNDDYNTTNARYFKVAQYVLTISQNSGWADKKTGLSIRLLKDSTTLSHGDQGMYMGNDGKVYYTICIGTQEWLADNLAETKYRNGDDIPEVTDNTAWAALTTGALCAYNNDWDNV